MNGKNRITRTQDSGVITQSSKWDIAAARC
jgi:hypothetical protein